MEPGAPPTSRLVLRDGSGVLVAPLHPDDRHRYLTGFERVSRESLYRRFMTPLTRLSESQLRYLLEIDHHDHEALLAVDEEGGEAVGVARFVRLADAPDAAEAAVLVADDWQGRGLGTALCRLLAERGRELGIARFEATLLVENRAMIALLESLGPSRVISREGPTIRVEVDLPQEDIGAHMRGVLRATASGEAELAEPPSSS